MPIDRIWFLQKKHKITDIRKKPKNILCLELGFFFCCAYIFCIDASLVSFMWRFLTSNSEDCQVSQFVRLRLEPIPVLQRYQSFRCEKSEYCIPKEQVDLPRLILTNESKRQLKLDRERARANGNVEGKWCKRTC